MSRKEGRIAKLISELNAKSEERSERDIGSRLTELQNKVRDEHTPGAHSIDMPDKWRESNRAGLEGPASTGSMNLKTSAKSANQEGTSTCQKASRWLDPREALEETTEEELIHDNHAVDRFSQRWLRSRGKSEVALVQADKEDKNLPTTGKLEELMGMINDSIEAYDGSYSSISLQIKELDSTWMRSRKKVPIEEHWTEVFGVKPSTARSESIFLASEKKQISTSYLSKASTILPSQETLQEIDVRFHSSPLLEVPSAPLPRTPVQSPINLFLYDQKKSQNDTADLRGMKSSKIPDSLSEDDLISIVSQIIVDPRLEEAQWMASAGLLEDSCRQLKMLTSSENSRTSYFLPVPESSFTTTGTTEDILVYDPADRTSYNGNPHPYRERSSTPIILEIEKLERPSLESDVAKEKAKKNLVLSKIRSSVPWNKDKKSVNNLVISMPQGSQQQARDDIFDLNPTLRERYIPQRPAPNSPLNITSLATKTGSYERYVEKMKIENKPISPSGFLEFLLLDSKESLIRFARYIDKCFNQ